MWSGVAGLARSPSAGPVPASCLAGWWGEGGRIYPAIRRLHRAHKTPPARLAGGPGLLSGRVWRAGFQSPFQFARQQLPRVTPCAGPVLALVLVLAVSGFGPALRAVGVVRPRRAAGPVLRLAPLPVRRGPCPVPVLLPCRSGAVRSAGPGPALARSWPPVRRGPPVLLPVQSGAAISESNRDFSAPYTGPKISSDFSGEVFYARGLSLDSWYINAPL